MLTLYDGNTKVISKIELVVGNFKVYNFTVDQYHTYYVSQQNVLVHNGNPCEFGNIYDLFKRSKVGAVLESVSSRFKDRKYKGAQIMEVTKDVEELGLKIGDFYYLDSQKKDHLEVFDQSGKSKSVIDANTGELIPSKTKAAEGRSISKIIKS